MGGGGLGSDKAEAHPVGSRLISYFWLDDDEWKWANRRHVAPPHLKWMKMTAAEVYNDGALGSAATWRLPLAELAVLGERMSGCV
jgi:hypothetical protein